MSMEIVTVKVEAGDSHASDESQSGLCAEGEIMPEFVSPEIIELSGSSVDIPAHRIFGPSIAQLDRLIKFMIKKPSLAVGHARTTIARHRARDAWREIAHILNSDGFGCIKTWEQWSKYWRDKKGTVKRKVAAIAAAKRNKWKGESDEVPELTETDRRIIGIMGGEMIITEDRSSDTELCQDNETQQDSDNDDIDDTNGSQAVYQMPEPDVRLNGRNSPDAGSGRTVRAMRNPRRRLLQQLPRGSVRPVRLMHPPAGPGRPRRLPTAPRPQRRPRSPDRTEITLAERFAAIEEQRAKAELALAQAHESYARSQEALARGQEGIVHAIKQLTDAVIALVNK